LRRVPNVFGGVLKIELVELSLEELFVWELGLILGDESGRKCSIKRILSDFVIFLAQRRTPIAGCS
jgi:hypothetical protein